MANPKRVNTEPPKTYDYRANPGAADPANDKASPHLTSFALAEIAGEPRVRDLDLAERLGFDRPRDVRKLITRNRSELECLGTCATVAHVVRGNPVTEYYLNEEQALLLAVLSNTATAREVRRVVIQTFVAYRRGQLTEGGHALGQDDRRAIGGIVKGVNRGLLNEALTEVLPGLIAEAIAAHQYGVVRGLTAGDVLDMAGVSDRKGLRNLPRRVSDRLRQFHAERGRLVNRATLGQSKAYIFDQATCREWLEAGGKADIAAWVAERRGQGVLHLVRMKD